VSPGGGGGGVNKRAFSTGIALKSFVSHNKQRLFPINGINCLVLTKSVVSVRYGL